MPLLWAVPFAGVLAWIALGPALAPRLWHRRLGLVTAVWPVGLLLAVLVLRGGGALRHLLEDALIGEYLPFVSLLLALSVAGGGIMVQGGPFGRPLGNTLLLAIGVVLGGLIGTTGASMVLIHPLLQANHYRQRKFHLVLFFIALVANAGGALLPLGAPLFLGLLAGVPLFWPLLHLGLPVLGFAAVLLLLFYAIDHALLARETAERQPVRLHLRGWRNLPLVALAVGSVFLPRLWGVGLCLVVSGVSLYVTPRAIRRANLWSAAPVIEVGKLFAGLFITMQPVSALLMQGPDGPLGPLLKLARSPSADFWIAGGMSAFLDNAPTYQLLFGIAGGNATWLAGAGSRWLAAISAGSVFFGALTYIGNAPNMMVQAIAARRGVRMPGFLGYLGWAALLLLPLLAVMQVVWF